MPKLVVLRGLPASGKTIHSAGLVLQGYKRVNGDDLRLAIDNGVYSKANEAYLVKVMQIMVKEAIKDGFDVVLDNTNLNPYHVKWARQVAKELNAKLEFIDMDTPLDVCLERDLNRTHGRVGKEVIMRMYNKWFKDGKLVPSSDIQ